MPIPVAGIAAGVSGIIKGSEAARREKHIQDRVNKYAGFSEDQLHAIITTYGGEMGEAAQRVLSSRGSRAQSTAPGPTITERLTGTGGSGTMLILLGGIVLIIVLLRK